MSCGCGKSAKTFSAAAKPANRAAIAAASPGYAQAANPNAPMPAPSVAPAPRRAQPVRRQTV